MRTEFFNQTNTTKHGIGGKLCYLGEIKYPWESLKVESLFDLKKTFDDSSYGTSNQRRHDNVVLSTPFQSKHSFRDQDLGLRLVNCFTFLNGTKNGGGISDYRKPEKKSKDVFLNNQHINFFNM